MSIHHHINSRAIIAACLLSAAGSLVFNAFPLFLGNIAGQFGFNDEQLGLLASAHLGGFAAVALIAPWWMPRLPWKSTGIAAYILIFISTLLLNTSDPSLVYLGMGLLGFGAGTIVTLSLGVLSAAKDPDRAFGWKLVAEMVSAGAVIWLMTSLVIDTFGYEGFIFCTLLLYALSTLALLGLPKNFLSSVDRAATRKTAIGGINMPAMWASLALFFQFGTFSGLWGFMERFGELMGVDSDLVDRVITLSVLAGIGGAFLCVFVAPRLGHRKSIVGALSLTMGAVALLYLSPGTLAFILAACSINALLQFLVATQMALVTDADSSGRYTIMMAFLLAAGGAIGPGVLGTILENLGLNFGYLWALLFTACSMVLTILATRPTVEAIPEPVNGLAQ